ncbi:MAG: XdhC family protein [Coriobacteriales bacterium]|jgi:xanthine dehydrogenase accessory factor|nr:XdhC family protein [Coriobacteriales bacterium]
MATSSASCDNLGGARARVTPALLVDALDELASALREGTKPLVSACIRQAFSCFDEEVLAGDPDISPQDLDMIVASLSPEDLPTLLRAREAVVGNEHAWLGFKIVTDPKRVCDSEDTAVAGFAGTGCGSADARPGVFFATQDKQIVFGRDYSARDRKQMLDITRGPHMHSTQYAGVVWASIPLEAQGRVIMFGAGDVSSELALLAHRCGFAGTVVVDNDESYLTASRFALSERVLVSDFDAIGDLGVTPSDYLCVLTRGHMHDPEALAYALATPAGYIGMMGSAGKNERVYELVEERGVELSKVAAGRVHAPIGIRFGGKTPPELAVSIVAQLIQVRDDRRKKAQ